MGNRKPTICTRPVCSAKIPPERRGSRYCSDKCEEAVRTSRENRAAIDLGLAVAGAKLGYGKRRTITELAAWCGCSKQNIEQIEKNALAKCFAALKRMGVRRDTL